MRDHGFTRRTEANRRLSRGKRRAAGRKKRGEEKEEKGKGSKKGEKREGKKGAKEQVGNGARTERGVTVLEIDDDECYVQSDMGEVTTCFVCELEE